MTPDWMEWDGWRWIAIAGAFALGRWSGWIARGRRERRLRRASAADVYTLARHPAWPPPREPTPEDRA